MRFIATIIVFFGFGMITIAPNIFYSAQGVEFRKKNGLGVIGVRVYTGFIAFFIVSFILTGIEDEELATTTFFLVCAAVALLIIPALLIRRSTKKKMIQNDFLTR